MVPSVRSRVRGSIWGVCVADALGGPVQFKEPHTLVPVTGLRFVEPFKQPAGSYSDDGAMTLALAQSIINSRGSYNHSLSIQYFMDWLFNGRFSTTSFAWDVGRSTRGALLSWQKRGVDNLETTQAHINRKLDRDDCSGNGSLMRIAPLGVALWRKTPQARKYARDQSRITHPSLPCVEACELYTLLLCEVMQGSGKERLCQTTANFRFDHPQLSERLARYGSISDWKTKSVNIRSSGWVIDTIEVALWAFFKYESWADGALAVVNLGGDSDTAGAVYGGLAGAFYGFELIPPQWIEGMVRKDLIGDIATKLADFATSEN
ncbi:ADP-ribosylation/Crystallin J1 [Aspergillus ambiguus]|uniref:ADP-ribosylglycohydrolase family protein n=1 Tax=Aspergillus ambiguus TaxID=176160 RepID=UPI003CCE1E06